MRYCKSVATKFSHRSDVDPKHTESCSLCYMQYVHMYFLDLLSSPYFEALTWCRSRKIIALLNRANS